MNVGQLNKFKSDVDKKLHEPNSVTNALEKIEQKTGIKRFYLVAVVVGIFALYLIFGHFAELVCNIIGFLYPAYISIKAIESVDKTDDTQWLTYWVVFALFNVVEFASDAIVGWFPVYWLCKCALMLYLYLPMTKGADKLYSSYIRPFVLKHQDAIDSRLGHAVGKASDAVRDQLNDHVPQKRYN